MRRNKKENTGRRAPRILRAASALGVAAFWIGVWWAASALVGDSLLLPSPYETLVRLAELAASSDLFLCAAASLLRVSVGIIAAVVAGILTAALCCALRAADRLVFPFMTVIKSTPVASFIILALVWLGTSVLPAFISFLMVYPLIFTNVRAGIRSVDPAHLRLCDVFGLSPAKRIRRIYIPTAYPYFVTSVKASLGLAWKAGIAAEVIAAPKYSIGAMLYQSKVYFETTDLFAWTLVIIIMSLLIELAFGKLIDVAASHRMKTRKGESEKSEA